MDIRILKPSERKYTYQQGQQISMQTGLIGYLRADMGSNGEGFFSSWEDFRKDLKTQEFKDEIDTVINGLREDGNILRNRAALARYCYSHYEASFGKDSFGDEREFGIRVDTGKYAYLMRLNPNKGEYNLYCYCYRKDCLDQHLKKAEKGIRFIDSEYNDLFRIQDGDRISITTKDGTTIEKTCRYIDEYHVEIDKAIFHIVEFAEETKNTGNICEPIYSSLPNMCYSVFSGNGAIVVIRKDIPGCKLYGHQFSSKDKNREVCDRMNQELNVSKQQEAAMQAGAVLGWDTEYADPNYYNADGRTKK